MHAVNRSIIPAENLKLCRSKQFVGINAIVLGHFALNPNPNSMSGIEAKFWTFYNLVAIFTVRGVRTTADAKVKLQWNYIVPISISFLLYRSFMLHPLCAFHLLAIIRVFCLCLCLLCCCCCETMLVSLAKNNFSAAKYP